MNVGHRAYGVGELLKLVANNPGIARQVDADLLGNPITDYDALLWGAYSPAVVRIVNLALARRAGGRHAPLTAEEMHAIACEAIGQASDSNFANPPQVISDYTILIGPGAYTYHDQVLKLVNLALSKLAHGPSSSGNPDAAQMLSAPASGPTP